MRMTLRIALSLAAVAGPFAAADAADYEPPIFVEDTPVVPVEVGSGWYLRGDVGYASTDFGEVNYRTFDPVTSTYGSAAFDTHDLDDAVTWGFGAGYQFSEWIRSDVTVEGFSADFNGTTASAAPCIDPLVDPAFAGTGCRSEDGSSVSAVSLMANGYVDLGTFVGVTPYVGAGLGYTHLSWDGLASRSFCVAGAGVCPPPGGAVSIASHGSLESWQFTYALMAGFAYDISENFKLDFGYKYRHIDGGEMFAFDAATAGLGATGAQGSAGDIEPARVQGRPALRDLVALDAQPESQRRAEARRFRFGKRRAVRSATFFLDVKTRSEYRPPRATPPQRGAYYLEG